MQMLMTKCFCRSQTVKPYFKPGLWSDVFTLAKPPTKCV